MIVFEIEKGDVIDVATAKALFEIVKFEAEKNVVGAAKLALQVSQTAWVSGVASDELIAARAGVFVALTNNAMNVFEKTLAMCALSESVEALASNLANNFCDYVDGKMVDPGGNHLVADNRGRSFAAAGLYAFRHMASDLEMPAIAKICMHTLVLVDLQTTFQFWAELVWREIAACDDTSEVSECFYLLEKIVGTLPQDATDAILGKAVGDQGASPLIKACVLFLSGRLGKGADIKRLPTAAYIVALGVVDESFACDYAQARAKALIDRYAGNLVPDLADCNCSNALLDM